MKYEFKVLLDAASEKDLLEGQTHAQIAETLYSLVTKDPEKGIAVGLQGSWGSGKSTVINLFKEKLNGKGDYVIFYFDAWAHEGDPLRRVFLESLIKVLNPAEKKGKLKDKADELSKRKKTIKIDSTKTLSWFGTLFILSCTLWQAGIGLINATKADGAPQIILQRIGWVLFPSPLIVVLFYLGCLVYRRYIKKDKEKDLKILASSSWPIVQGTGTDTITQNVSEDEERSSIEFEKCFSEILEDDSLEDKKLIIVIDNLDRVDPKDSLKIWSTLQTFLQRNNKICADSDIYNKIWIIVPYDEDGLAKLWDKNVSTDDSTSEPTSYSKSVSAAVSNSFFDKCFQLRIDVPPMLYSGWEAFLSNKVNESFVNWEEKDKATVVNIVKWISNYKSENYTPRQIIKYINQVGILRNYLSEEISINAISIYCVHRYLKNKSNKHIKEELLSNTLFGNIQSLIQDNTLLEQVCGILFGVSPTLGRQLLLEPKIKEFLENQQPPKLSDLADKHKELFSLIFKDHLSHLAQRTLTLADYPSITSYANTIYHGLWKNAQYAEIMTCNEFKGYLEAISKIDDIHNMQFTEYYVNDGFIALLSMLKENQCLDGVNYWDILLKDLSGRFGANDFKIKEAQQHLSKMAEIIPVNKLYVVEGNERTYGEWLRWIKSNNELGLELYKYLVYSPSYVTDDLLKLVSESDANQIIANLKMFLEYGVKAGLELDITIIINGVIEHIKRYSEQRKALYSIDFIQFLNYAIKSELSNDVINKLIVEFLKIPASDAYIAAFKNEGSIKEAALLKGRLAPGEILSATPIKTEINNWWVNGNETDAEYVLENICTEADVKSFWILAHDSKNKLIGKVLALAINTSQLALFKYGDTLSNYVIGLNRIDREKTAEYVKIFLENTNIIEEILQKPDTELKMDKNDYSYGYYCLISYGSNKKLKNRLSKILSTLEEAVWFKSFDVNLCLLLLLITLRDKDKKVALGAQYCEALINILKKWINDNDFIPNKWFTNNLKDLIECMSNDYIVRLAHKLSEQIIEKKFVVNSNVKDLIPQSIKLNELYTSDSSRRKLEDALEAALEKDDVNTFEFIYNILSSAEDGEYKPTQPLPEVIGSDLNTFKNKHPELEEKIKDIAKRLNVVLDPEASN